MNSYRFIPQINKVGEVQSSALISEIESERMLHGASIEFALKEDGPLTKRVLLEILNKEYISSTQNFVIDTKSVMLMPGFYPSIPGFHCNGVIRKDRYSQPDLNKINPNMVNYVCNISDSEDGEGATSATSYLNMPKEIEYDPKRVWGSVDRGISKQAGIFLRQKDGEIIKFTQPTLHSATPSIRRGWRFWFRMSEYHMKPVNKIRHQVQVYASNGLGW